VIREARLRPEHAAARRRRIGDLALPDTTPLLFPRRPISNRQR
jgi:hypothetical protein